MRWESPGGRDRGTMLRLYQRYGITRVNNFIEKIKRYFKEQ